MSPKPQILWIDDNPDRKKQAMDLENDSGRKVEFIPAKGKNIEELIEKIINEYKKPKLVIIDHVLDKTNSKIGTRFGSSLVGILRDTWDTCPFLGISAAGKIARIDIGEYAYDELIEGDRFSEYIRYIPNVIEGFKKCTKVDSVERWINLLKCPKEEKNRIKECIPRNIKANVQKKGFANRAYRWFSKKFYSTPGFLYDKNWVATFAGVKIEAIDKYIKYFNSAKYDGIFNNPDSMRWWKATLYRKIYSKSKDINVATRSSQDVANEVLKVKKKFRSKCHACGEVWPDTMAYVDDSENASMKQMHLRCTVAHPDYRYEPMFEEIRVMIG